MNMRSIINEATRKRYATVFRDYATTKRDNNNRCNRESQIVHLFANLFHALTRRQVTQDVTHLIRIIINESKKNLD